HAVRAAEIQLDAIRAGVLRPLDNVVPRFALRLDHERNEERMTGVSFLDAGDLLQVDFERAVTDQFNVVQAHHLAAVVIDAAIARADVYDWLVSNGLPDRPTPAGVKSSADLILGVGRRSGSQPERIGGLDATKLDA